MEKLKKTEQALCRLERGLLVALLGVIVLMSFSQVLLRQLFSTGILWGDTLLRHLVLWTGFLGAALAAAEGKHFAWEAPAAGRAGAVLRLLAQTAAAGVAGLLAWASWKFLKDERAAGSVLFTACGLSVTSWVLFAILPAGFLLVLIHSLLRAARALGDLR